MDAGLAVPFTSIRFGLDPIIGLVPGLGDAAGALLSTWIVIEAVRLGASGATVARMAGNIAVDALTGTVPLLGDVFDVAWKANLRNVALIERHLGDPVDRRSDQRFVGLGGQDEHDLVLPQLHLLWSGRPPRRGSRGVLTRASRVYGTQRDPSSEV